MLTTAMRVVPVLVTLLLSGAAIGQVRGGAGELQYTLEAYANGVGGTSLARGGADDGAGWQADGGLRLLLLQGSDAGRPRPGIRLALEGEAGETDDLSLAEFSALWLGPWGRLEAGRRQGLPEVLTGYAPNNFSFVGADFGPASGLSLDPGGGLVSRLLGPGTGARLDELSLLGVGAALAPDRSDKLVYVTPKIAGYLGGLSYVPEARGRTDLKSLWSAGLTREHYWDRNVLRVGGSYARAELRTGGALHSYHAGAALTWRDDWQLGIGATVNPDAGPAPVAAWAEEGIGVVASLNYNHGPWTAGGFVQWGRSRPPASGAGPGTTERLRAGELGLSYRFNLRFRAFAAWYFFDLDGTPDADAAGHVIALGFRLTA